ncbi:SlyX family protein [Leucothrix pacifica]|uniref:Protein SlyX homolog n=1 Tax=Leucothrix pacifica TaxID=1247513 RepID=A0A317C267_9GAMM|nr:SlyX family protein [Leucothrix pacifica]PWQ92756.1 hypothetical protein DKW60_19295 [Leucothrix pacifica]
MSLEDRITNLEILLTQQDDVVDTLNRLVHDQRLQVEALQQQVKRLEEKLGNSGGSNMASEKDETPPPHY